MYARTPSLSGMKMRPALFSLDRMNATVMVSALMLALLRQYH
jgi:hypothetical protein